MAITLDEAVTQTLGAQPKPADQAPATDNALSAAVDRMYDPGREAAKTVLSDALKALPEQAANDQQMARAAGLPLDLVERNREQVQQSLKLRELQQVVSASPVLQAQMMNPEFAKLAHDDAPVLGGVAQALQIAGNVGKATLSGIGPKFNEGAWGLVRAVGDVMGEAGRPISESAARLGGVARAQADALMPKASNVWEGGVYSGFQSLGLNLTQLPLAFLPGGQAALAGSMAPRMAPTLASMGLNTGGQAYGQARDQGVGVVPSLIFGGSQGLIEAGTEMIGLPALFRLLKPGQMGTKALEYLLREQGGEQIATALQDLNEWAVLPENKTKGIDDYLSERPNAALQTAIATAVGGGAQVALMKGAGGILNQAEYSQFKAQQSEQRAAMLAQLGELASASKVLQRDPGSFEQFVAKAAEDGPVDTVYIDGQVLMQSGVAAQVAAASPAVAEQLTQAAQTGGTVAIPVADYAANIAPTEYAQALQDHLRTEPDGYSPAEAKLYMQEQGQQVQEQLERAISQAQQSDEFRASAEAVKSALLEQLNTAQRFRPEVNEAYAAVVSAYYATRAAQMGVTASELFAQRRLRIGSQQLNGLQFDQGQNDQTDDVDEATGLPLNADGTVTVYHHTSAVGAEAIRKSGKLKAEAEPDVYVTTRRETDTGYGDTAVPIRVRPDQLSIDDEFPDGRKDFRLNVGKPGGSINVTVANESTAPDSGGAAFSRTTGNNGQFDPNDPNILHQGPRGTFSPEQLAITLLRGADLTSFLHESAHFFFENDIALASEILAAQHQGASITAGEQQILDDVGALLTWHGLKGDVRQQLAEWHNLPFEEKRSHHEKTAESFEAYLFSGKAPSAELAPYFQRFRAWLVHVYRGLKEFLAGYPQAGELTPEVRQVFDRMLASNDAILAAEQSRSMLALFETAEQGGFSPEAWAAYQGIDAERTQDAVQELQARGLRDLQWLRGARSRELKALQKQARGLRAAIETDVRQQIMAEPVYRAWRFLTNKLTDADKIGTPPAPPKSSAGLNRETDSLLVAIAKLGGIARESAGQHLGVHKDDFRTPSGVFGKPVFRKDGGLSADAMAELLAADGYLTTEEDGKHDLRQLEELISDELGGRPQYSAFRDPALANEMRAGDQVRDPDGLGAGRLDLDSLREMYGTPEAGQMPVWQRLKDLRMTSSKDAMHPDIVAQLFGFTSGDELVQTLLATNPLKDEIQARVDQRMIEQHGELATPEALDRAADAAVHNAARARMVATEMDALAKATGTQRAEIKLLAEAARQFARETVARLKVRALKPSMFSSAQARAAQAASAAMKRGDAPAAMAEKRNELLQTQSARAAHEALSEIERGLKYLRRFDGNVKGLDAEYRDQIDALLERFDLRKATSLKAIDKRKSLAQWMESQREQGIEPNVPQELLDAAERKSYKDMTVEEFRGLVDTVRQIEHIGRLKDKLLTAKDAREVSAAIAQAAATVREHGGEAREQPLERERGVMPWLRGVLADHRKFASLLRQMDGGTDRGPLQELLVRTMHERGHWEAGRNQQATEALGEIFEPVTAQKGGTVGKSSTVFIPEIGASLTRQSRLAVLLNWGNETNRQRLMEGFGWSEAQVGAILRTLSHADVMAANQIWSFIDSFWPEIEAKERRMTGSAPEKVQALPFVLTLADGTQVEMRGGYYPLKRDDAQGRAQTEAQLADEMKRGAFTKATTRRGHTKARTEGAQYRLLLDLSVITQHVQQVNHDLAWHEWLTDANKLLDPRRELSQAIVAHYGQEVMDTLRKHLEAIATGDLQTGDAMQRALMYLRGTASRMTMGLSLTTALMQPFGLTQSMVRIGPKHVIKGMARWVGDAAKFENSMAWIGEKSDMMRLRNLTFNRELSEINASVSRGKSTARKVYDASLFYLMQKMQLIADVPTWIGAYEKALAEGVDEAAAVASADQAVLDSQGGGQTKDTARIQREHPFLAMFYSYFSVTYNLMAESTGKTNFRSPASIAGWFTDMALLAVIPALGPSLLVAMLRGEGDDKEWDWWVKKLAEWQAGYLLGTMVGLREVSGAVSGFDYAGPPVGRLVAEVGKFGKQVAQGEADEAFVRSLVSVVGAATGVPTTQAMRSWNGWKAWDEGRAPPTSVLMGPPPKH